MPRSLVFAGTALFAFIIYLLTLAPDLTWAHYGVDGGDLITASMTGGIPHPSGYPTYTILAKLFSYLPLGTIAYRFNLFSAVCIALTAGLLTFQLSIINYQSSIAAGLTFAFFPLVWSQAIITEVYGLNLLLVGLYLWMLDRQRPFLTALLLGLATTTHLTSLFLIPLVLIRLRPQNWLRLSIGFALGLTPFLILPLLALGDSPVVWGDPTTLSGWWWLISGQIYRANLLALPPDQWLTRLAEWHRAGLWQVWLLLPIIGLSGYRSIGSSDYRKQADDPIIRLSEYTIAIAYFLYAFTYNTPDAIILILPAILILCRHLPAGFATFSKLLPSNQAIWLPLLLPLILLLLNFKMLNLRHDTTIRPQAEHLLQQAHQQAILLTPGDETVFTLWYYHHVEGQRPDLILVDANLFAFDWYRRRLAQLYPDLAELTADDLVRFEQANIQKRPFCHASFNTTPTVVCQ